MRISEAGVDLIKHFEGCRLSSYPDEGGKWTIGFGHCAANVKPRTVITPDEADELLQADLRETENEVFELLEKTEVTQGQFDALICFCFNLGQKRLRYSQLLRKLKAGDVQGAADEFLRWTYVQGKFVRGLATRRAAEREMFLNA